MTPLYLDGRRLTRREVRVLDPTAASLHVRGAAPPQQRPTARFETKPAAPARRGSDRRDSGGGYERWRSWEYRPETPGTRKADAYVAVHRLCAVAWLLPADAPLSALDGMDVHHNAPAVEGDRGVEWDNREGVLELLDHGRHAEITQAERRAWAEDAKRDAERAEQATLDTDRGPACDECGATGVPLASGEGFDGRRCPDCVAAFRERQEALAELEELTT